MGQSPAPETKQDWPIWAGYGAALITVVFATLAALIVDHQAHVPNLSLVFVLPVVLAAALFGWGPALVAAAAGVLAYNYFLIEPRYTLRVADPANVWALFLLLVVASAVSAIAAQSRRQAVQARKAGAQAWTVHVLARALVAETTQTGVAQRCAETLSGLFQAPSMVLVHEGGDLQPVGLGGGAVVADIDLEAARWALLSGRPTRGGSYPHTEARFDFWPLTTPQRQQAVVGVRISGREEGRPEAPERLVETVTGYLSMALDREAYARQVLEGRVLHASEELKTELLAAVSHDLKTPLSTILFTLQSLRRFEGEHDAATRGELLAAAEAEAARLSRMVENLLDMNRIEAGAMPVRPAPTAAADLAAAAVAQASPALAGRKLINDAEGGPRLMVDPALFETALANLLDNAVKYSPEGSTIRITSGCDDGMGWVEVLDEGPGFAGLPEPLFEKFARGREGDGRPPGTGLGLSIARGFLEAQGGRIEAADRDDGPGARVRLLAPLA